MQKQKLPANVSQQRENFKILLRFWYALSTLNQERFYYKTLLPETAVFFDDSNFSTIGQPAVTIKNAMKLISISFTCFSKETNIIGKSTLYNNPTTAMPATKVITRKPMLLLISKRMNRRSISHPSITPL